MKLELMSGQPGVELNTKFSELLKLNGYYDGDLEQKNFMIFPELELRQQKIIYDVVRERIRKHLETNNDLFILTYSDHVLNALRMEVKIHNFEGVKIHQLIKDGDDIVASISKEGRMDIWVDDIFDVWDRALGELVE